MEQLTRFAQVPEHKTFNASVTTSLPSHADPGFLDPLSNASRLSRIRRIQIFAEVVECVQVTLCRWNPG